MKFDQLSRAVEGMPNRFALNEQGRKLLEEYHTLIGSIAAGIEPKIESYLSERNEEDIEGQGALLVIGLISSKKAGTEEFDLMSQLDKLTNGGKTDIDGTKFTFHQDDPINKYIDPVRG